LFVLGWGLVQKMLRMARLYLPLRELMGKGWVLFMFVFMGSVCMAATGEMSFTPTELKYPITKIEISTDMSSAGPSGKVFTLYSCTENCDLDLMDQYVLDSIVRSTASIEVGSYRYVKVTSCADGEDTYRASILGEVTIGVSEYKTHSTLGITTDGDPSSVDIPFNQCASYYQLQHDLEIGDSVSSSLRLVFDLEDIAWATKSAKPFINGCFESLGDVHSVCMMVPQFVPIQFSGSLSNANRELYKIKEDAGNVGAKIILFMDSDTLLGGFARRFFDANSQPLSAAFDTAIKHANLLETGSYSFGTVGELSSELSESKLSFARFSRDTHTRSYKDADGVEVNYTATIEE
jgi:hypothetical protein